MIVTVDRRESRPLAVTAELTVDFGAEKVEIFRQGWTLMRDNFFDAGYNGVDWRDRAGYEPRIASPDGRRDAKADESDGGELNSSHLA